MPSFRSFRKSFRSVLLTAALLLPLICACLTLTSLAVGVTVLRYDGMNDVRYEPCDLYFQVGVTGAPDDAVITYNWQVSVGCIAYEDRWFDVAVCNYASPYNTDTFWVHAEEGNAATAAEDRFVYRCVVTVDGKEYVSPMFDKLTHPMATYDTISITGLTAPVAGAKPSTSYQVGTSHLEKDGIEWFSENMSTNAYAKMGSNETFKTGYRYYANIYLRMEDGWKADFDKTVAKVNNVSARLLSKPKDSRVLRIIAEYVVQGTGSSTAAPADPTLADVLTFWASEMDPPVQNFDEPVDVYVAESSDLHLYFPYLPLSGTLLAQGYSIEESWNYYENGTMTRESNEITDSFSLLNAKKVSGEQTLEVSLRLAKNGKVFPYYEKVLQYRIHVTESGSLPEIYSATHGTVTYKEGDNIILRCRASGAGLTYQWMVFRAGKTGAYTWQPYYSPDGGLLLLKDADSSFDGLVFKCRVSNAYGSDESQPVYLAMEGGDIQRVDLEIPSFLSAGILSQPAPLVLTQNVAAGESILYYAPDPEKTFAAIPNGMAAFMDTLEYAAPGSAAVSDGVYFVVMYLYAVEGFSFGDGVVAYANGTNIPVRERSEHAMTAVMRFDAGSGTGSGLKGDVNGDGEVDVIDYILVKRRVLGTATLTSEQQSRADVNKDGEIDIIDYTIIKRIALGVGVG